MRKRILISALFVLFLFITGCADAGNEQAAMIEELPIEQQNTSASMDSEIYEQEKEPYEAVEVEVNGEKGTITVGTTGAPYTELLTQAKIQLAKDAWDVQVKKYDDYQKINEDVINGTLDAHLFAHQTYIDSKANIEF